MPRIRHQVLLCAIIASTALAGETVQDRVVTAAADDADMNAAMNHARATLDDFLTLAAKPPQGASGFKVKVRVEDPNGVEHLWVVPFRHEGDNFVGVISDDPELVKSVKDGETYHFTRTEISDWGYVLNGKQKGSFTVCVLFKKMPRAEVEQYRKDYGFEC